MKAKQVIILALIVVALGAFYYFDLGQALTLENLKANRIRLQETYGRHTLAFVAGYIGIYILQTALSLPGATVLSLAGGAIFGTLLGTLYVNIGATLGATAAFFVARTLLREWVEGRFGRRIEGIDRGLRENGLNYLLFLRLVPLFPFFLINLASGLTGLPLRTYIIGTMIGILPGSFVYVNAGASLATIESVSGIASPRVLGSFALLGLFALLPAVYKKLRAKGEKKP